MRIKKVSQTTSTQAQVVDGYSTSTTDSYSCNYVNTKVVDTYSTDEVKTNKVWINNKPIYRKMLRKDTVSTSTYTMIPTGIPFETIGEITGMKVLCKQNNSNTWFAAPANMSSNEVFGYYLTGTNVVVKSDWELEKITVVLEYTKTTD